MRTQLAIPFTTLAATLALAGTAAADIRYAAPDGDGPVADCLLADPCSLKNAAEFAGEGDLVRVLDGTYELTDRLDLLDGGVTMEPAAAGTRPVIRLDSDGNPAVVVSDPDVNPLPVTIRGFHIENTSDLSDSDAHPALRVNSPAAISDVVARSRGRVLEVVVEDAGATVLENAQVQQVAGAKLALLLSTGAVPQGTVTGRGLTVNAAEGGVGARVIGPGSALVDSVLGGGADGVSLVTGAVGRRVTAGGTQTGIRLDGPTTLTDAVATAGGAGARALAINAGGAHQVRNVTALASGTGSVGIAAAAGAASVRNAFARGDETDVKVTGGSMAIDHSNFRTQSGITDGGANQGGDPQFVAAAAGDFRLAPTSPAIDAGVADDVLGATDRAGASRFQLAAPDLGAYEAAAKGAPQPGAPVADVTAPALSALRATGKRRGAAKASFTLGEAATVTVKLQRAKAGKRKAGRCVEPTRKLRKAKSCTRFVSVATAVKALPAGTATVKVGRKLGAGRYRVSVVARDAAGNAAKPSVKRFRIKAR